MIFWSVLLLVHMLLAVTLLGTITHQAVSVLWPNSGRSKSFIGAYRGVNSTIYINAVIVLFLCTAVLGSIIYPNYRLNVRPVLHTFHFYKPEGSFEFKEHAVALGAALLPAYWYFWRYPADGNRAARNGVTIMLALIVWWSFLVGHILNNIRGFGS